MTNDHDKLNLSFDPKKDPDVMKQALKDMDEQFDVMIQFGKIQSRLWRSKYNALVKEGFTKEEALTLCWRQ